MKKDEALKAALEAAYLAGFNDSAEGYNSEYPFGGKDQAPTKDAHWIKGRDNYIKEALAQPTVKESLTVQPTCKQILQVEQERNFCPRCGKRLGSNDWDLHTCTPPRGKE